MKLVNRAKMTITAVASSGTGTLTLGAASTGGFSTFADAGVSNGETVRYTIEGPGDLFEIGSGVYTASGTTLSRSPSESSNANNSAITATTDSVVFVTAAAADLGAAVHSDINGLVAQTGMTVGDTALVTSTNKLYMYTASGWFLIATMTNASPSAITGTAASYTLATDGTATIITLASTDPEGFPITFSHTVSTGSLGSTATVTQGTGANANVFTITPSTNNAHSGTFSLTFSASDGNSVSQAISEFKLAFGFNLSFASYDNLSFSVSSQDGSTSSLAFNSDGTKMFAIGYSTDTVYEFDLTTGFDLTSGNVAYNNISFSVSSQSFIPRGFTFSSDGTKMFVLDQTSTRVYQYGLTTGFDLSTASYDSKNFSVSSQDSSPRDLKFNSDGTKMFVVGSGSDSIYQFSLTTGFDLTSGNVTYDNVSLDVSSEDSNPEDLAFSADGTKMFVLGNSTIYQYTLTTGFDLSSASYDSINLDISSQETGAGGLEFNPDGTKMFHTGYGSDKIHQYSIG